jgi:fibro-slime domain-containing protein
VVTALSLGLFDGGCGARTALMLPEPCGEAVDDGGAPAPPRERGCENTCGAGTQICEFGYWQPCVVPVATRPCSDTCGAGTQSCVDDDWLTCQVPVATRACSSVCGSGTETCSNDAWSACDAALPGPPTLAATVRNVKLGQPDFLQSCCTGGVDPGIVAAVLGADGTPVYAGNSITGTLTTHGAADFAQWYHDVPGINVSGPLPLLLTPEASQPGINVFDDQAFFPIDDQLLGNQGAVHNFNFTVQAHAMILYNGGESYGFTSDDDLWVFINHHLVVDLGGLHSGTSEDVELDQVAGETGIVTGQSFPLDLFYANREPPGAVLVLSIPQADLWSCP